MAETLSLAPLLFFLLLLPLLPSLSTITTSSSLTFPISKDPSTSSLHTISLSPSSLYLLDLSGPLLWSPCPLSPLSTIPCNSTTCALAFTAASPPPSCSHLLLPNHSGRRHTSSTSSPCTTSCVAYPSNPITSTCAPAELTRFSAVNIPGVDYLIASCAPPSLLAGLPASASGVVGLSRSPLSLPTQLSLSSLSLKPQFSLCLSPSPSSPGAIAFGATATSLPLSFTPLLQNPMKSSGEYFVGISGISVNGVMVSFLARMLEFDALGHGGTKLSTTAAYTAMRTHIYLPFLKAAADATQAVPRAPKVFPFDLCVRRAAMKAAPRVDLLLASGKNWTVASMMGVSPDVACLAFVDGGPKAEHAVVVGVAQMEDNLMVFDVGGSRLGFGGVACEGFKFSK